MKNTLYLTVLIWLCQLAHAQIGIGTTTPHASSILDLVATDKGLLVPRMTQAERSAITTPATGLLVYQTDGSSGFYYFNGSSWEKINTGTINAWELGGNNGTNPANDFIGTADATDLVFRTDNTERMRISSSGLIGIGTNSPSGNLHLHGSTGAKMFFTHSSVSNNGLELGLNLSNEAIIRNQENGPLLFFTNNTQRMVITAGGNVGIGVTTPTAELHTTGTVRFENYSSGTNGAILRTNTTGDLVTTNFSGSSSDVLRGDGTFGSVPGGGNNWGILGNSGTIDGTHFIGTTDDKALNFRVNNIKSGRIGTASDKSVFLGFESGLNDDLSNNENTFIGFQSGKKTTTGQHNVALGSKALSSNTTGFNNVALGKEALYSNVSGLRNIAIGSASLYQNTANDNIAIGYEALSSNTSATRNIAVGTTALTNNTVQGDNIAIGYNALLLMNYSTAGSTNNVAIGNYALENTNPTTGSNGRNNVAVGNHALRNNTQGFNNTANGYQALSSNTTGSSNTANGYQALYSNTSGSNNTANGNRALYSNTSGSYNSVNGNRALYSNTTGSYNTANGSHSLYLNTNGSYNTANGYEALFNNTTGDNNTAIGVDALHTNVAGNNATAIGTGAMLYANNNATSFTNYNVAVGFEALRGSTNPSLNTGNYNTALGYQTLWNNTTGNNNTANGYRALYNNNSGNNNTANGYLSLSSNSTGYNNTANGSQALSSNSTGYNNTANGSQALSSNSTGYNNTANGYQALFSNTINHNNTAFGYQALYSNNSPFTTQALANTAVGSRALYSNTTGVENTAVGSSALYSNTTGNDNTAVGIYALQHNQTGHNNTALGYNAGRGNSGVNFSSCTFIGANSFLTTSRTNVTLLGAGIADGQCNDNNQVLLGNTAVAQIRAPVGTITTYSDKRFKFNIQEDVPGLNFINRLKPVTYQQNPEILHQIWGTPDSIVKQIDHSEIKQKRFIGFLAQDVDKAAKECNWNFPGIDIPRNEKEVYSLRYVDFIMPLVKSVQELNAQNEKLQSENAELKTRLKKLEQENTEMKAQIQKINEVLNIKAEK